MYESESSGELGSGLLFSEGVFAVWEVCGVVWV